MASPPPPTPETAPAAPGPPPRLLTLTRVRDLFCDRLAIAESTYYESFRDALPVVYTRAVPVKGRPGEFRPGSPRVREDVARALVEVAARGEWGPYSEGALEATHPHLYAERAGTVGRPRSGA